MDEKLKNGESQTSSIENRIGDYFSNYNLNSEQINRIKECLNKEVKQSKNGEENSIIKEKKLLRKYKQIIEGSANIEEGIKKIETELNEIRKNILDVNNGNLGNETNNSIGITENTENEETTFIMETNSEDIEKKQTDLEKKQTDLDIKSGYEKQNELIETLFNKVSESYSKIDEKYKKIDQKKLEEAKTAIPEKIKEKLTSKNITEEQLNQYIQYTIIRDNIYELGANDNKPETRDFLKNLKDLEDNLGIRTETKKGIPLTTKKEVFQENPQLNNFKENNDDIKELGNTSYFGKEKINVRNTENLRYDIAPYKKMENLYKDSKDFPRDDERFKEISKKISEEKYSEITNDDYNYYTSKLDGLNGWITNFTQGAAAQAPLTGILRYLDSYSGFGKDTLADRFEKGKSEYITMNDSTMRIEGIIDGNPLSFYYDVKDGQTKISCDDILHIENGEYKIYNGTGEYPKSDLKINMPSIKNIVDNLKDIPQEEYTKLLMGSNNIKEFQSKITELITNKIKETFPENETVKTRMKRFTEKNLTAQAFDAAIVGNNTEFKNNINSEPGTELTPIKRMLLLVDNTTEQSTPSELIEFKGAFNNLNNLLSKSKKEIKKIKDPVLRINLLNIKKAKEKNNYKKRVKATTKFFSLFERKNPNETDYKIDIDNFSTFIDLGFKDEETQRSTIENFGQEFFNEYQKQNPAKKKLEKQSKEIHDLAEAQQKKDKNEAEEELNASLAKLEEYEA